MLFTIGLSIFCAASLVQSLELPSYITPCIRSDPNFNDCVVKTANEVMPTIIKGDRKYRIPSFDPLKIDEMEVEEGTSSSPTSFKIKSTRVLIHGLPKAKMTSAKHDFKSKRFTWDITVPRVESLSHYDMSGKILFVPLKGDGESNITTIDCSYSFTVNYDLDTRSDGKQYMVLNDTSIQYKVGKVHVHLTNLFNGNEELGSATNKFLNDNWREAYAAVNPILLEAIKKVLTSVLVNFTDLVPYDSFFPNK